MKASELRIGNYVRNKISKKEFRVMRIDVTETSTNTKAEPIPLTEQHLLNFGAKELRRENYSYSRFKLSWKPQYKYWYVLDQLTLTYLTKIEFVHEFQNFIFAMDGKELTLSPQEHKTPKA